MKLRLLERFDELGWATNCRCDNMMSVEYLVSKVLAKSAMCFTCVCLCLPTFSKNVQYLVFAVLKT